MKLIGANANASVAGADPFPGKSNYFVGNDPKQWRTNLPTYARVRYEDVYPGIDLAYYGNQRQIEYDFIVAPGSTPDSIKLGFQSARHLAIADNGDLIINQKGGSFRQQKPVAYQQVGEAKKAVSARYIIRNANEVGFEVESYDTGKVLVIDPVLDYSTYLGGAWPDECHAIAVDTAGNAYVAGNTLSLDFPVTPNAFQTKPGFGGLNTTVDAFVVKLNAAGNGLMYSTFLGGGARSNNPTTGYDDAQAIAIDSAGNVYIAGFTTAFDFPTTAGAFQTTLAFGGAFGFAPNDAFVSKLGPNGDSLIYSTYLGGFGVDEAYALALDSNNNAYVTGKTDSTNFPVTNGVRQSTSGGNQEGFVTKLNATGTALTYSTYLGGPGSDWCTSIAVDSAANVYVAGITYGPDSPVTPGAFPTTAGAFRVGSSGMADGFVSKLNSNASAFIYSTYLGGIGDDFCAGLALDSQGQVYVTGNTESNNFPVTPNAYRTAFNGSRYLSNDIFVTKLNDAGSQLVYSTYVSSPTFESNDGAHAIALNNSGEAFVAGNTTATNFQTTNDAVQRQVSDGDNGILFKLNAGGTDLGFATYLGGNGYDFLQAIALDGAGAIYVAGFTRSTDFPVTPGSFRPFTSASYFDSGGVVAKIGAPVQNVFSISGRITDADNIGISNVMIKLTGPVSGSQWTDPQGNYSFGNLPAGGTYSVEPASPYYDFSPPSQTFTNLNANQTAFFTALLRHFKISGQILNSDGQPATGVTVVLSGSQAGNTVTDNNGNYTINDLPATGSYTVQPTKAHYLFDPFSARFTTLPGNQTANFTAYLYYVISGRVVNSISGLGIEGIRVNISGTQNGSITTDFNGDYSLAPLIPGGNFLVTPDSPEYSFLPLNRTYNNLSGDQTEDFSGTGLYGNIRGRVVDQTGQGLYGVSVALTGPATSTGFTDTFGNFTFNHLRKGTSYQLTAALSAYSFTPASVRVTVAGDDNTVMFVGQPNQLRPFTSGNIVTTASKFLSEYTPTGTTVQTVIVPFPVEATPYGYYLGDVAIDQNGEAEIYNGPAEASYLTSYVFTQGLWRHHSYPGWNPWTGYNSLDGIATLGNYAYVTDKTTNDSGGNLTQGIIRINLADYTSQRFASDLTFRNVTIGQDGLLYGIVGNTSGSQINAYNLSTLALVKTINLAGAQNVGAIAVNQSGDIFAIAFDVFHYNSTGGFVKSVRLQENLNDIEISSTGQLGVVASGKIYLLDQSLNILSSFISTAGANFMAFTNSVPPPAASIKFSSDNYQVVEGAASATITVTRAGDTSNQASVDYSTSNATARQSRDYAAATGTLSFAAGQSSRSFNVLITDNVYVDGNRTINLNLSNPKGAPLVSPISAVFTIADNDTASPTANPIDESQFFVRQHYADFLSRSPDPNGMAFWVDQINQCGTDQACIKRKRNDVSNAFYYELEYQQTGSYVYRLYRAAFGNDQPFPNPAADVNHPGEERKVVSYQAFVQDRSRVVGGANLAQKQLDLANAFVQRGEFLAKYPLTLDGPAFVDAVLLTIKNDLGADLTSQRQDLINLFTSSGRGGVLYRLADDNIQTNPINNRALVDAEYNRAFVATQYFGYLRRDPDMAGLLFWLGQVNTAPLRDVAKQHAMVCSFITSTEYQQRFSSVVTHSNAECQ
jgi:hypothetical protein